MRKIHQLVAALGLCGVLTACQTAPVARQEPAEPAILSSWVQMAPENQALARAIVRGSQCPEIAVTLVSPDEPEPHLMKAPMKVRANAQAESFPVLSCEFPIPAQATAAQIGENVLSLPKKNPARILVLGDTGCRIKGKDIQSCNDPNQWPLATIAASAAKWKPDLVVHVGDYYYREAPCPKDKPGCQGATSGDVWKSWEDDFFTPANSLLKDAPWVFTRGNHELCSRGGRGWFRFLDPNAYSEVCKDQTAPFALHAGDHLLWIMDSADEHNHAASLSAMRRGPKAQHTWIFTHRPLLTPGPINRPAHKTIPLAPSELPASTDLVLAGHLHVLSLNRFHDWRPLEFISGNGATALDTAPADATAATRYVSQGKSDAGYDYDSYWDFGFLTLERQDGRKDHGRWQVIAHDRNGAEVLICGFREKSHGKSLWEGCRKLK